MALTSLGERPFRLGSPPRLDRQEKDGTPELRRSRTGELLRRSDIREIILMWAKRSKCVRIKASYEED